MASKSLSAFVGFATLLAFGAHAQVPDPKLYFYPAKTWDVLKAAGDVCSYTSEYNNGYILSFSGSAAGVNSLDIDFRQSAFDVTETYELTLNIPGVMSKFLSAQPSAPNILNIDLTGHEDLYPALIPAGVLDIGIEGNEFRFYLTGFSENAQGFGKCLTPTAPEAPIMASAEPQVPQPVTLPPPSQASLADMDPIAASRAAMPPQHLRRAKPDMSPEQIVHMQEMAKAQLDETKTNESVPSEPETISVSTPEPVVTKEVVKGVEMDITDIGGTGTSELARSKVENEIIRRLQADNEKLRSELAAVVETAAGTGDISLSSADWNLEKATMRFQEAERQMRDLGQKLQKQRAQCKMEKKELEALLFDPQLTNERQLAELADLEQKLAETESKLNNQRVQFEAQIKILKDQMAEF